MLFVSKMMNEVKEKITSCLPDLGEQKLQELMHILREDIRVATVDDLALVEQGDITCVVKRIQARKLLLSWKKGIY